MKSHQLTERIPEHLKPYIARQDPALYTPMDHAGWRFILKISREFFIQHAHKMYLDGLDRTGISSERIPLIGDMDEKLQKFSWRAVPVCGFIPPSVFMEFLSLGILPIACDMRSHEHLSYTPAPDIVHEAAGHAPIIAEPEYADYLRQYGEISRKAIHSAQDWEVYCAIRDLSDIKEAPTSTDQDIRKAQTRLDAALKAVDHVSEASELARMSWWTIEYGLIGSAADPKIYGAGLLSSVGESYRCLGPEIRKVPFSLECIKQGYDITKPQPQLFVAQDFSHLTRVLEELANTMAFRKGGEEGLQRAKKAATVTTTVLDSGIQISGIVTDCSAKEIRFKGPIQFAFEDRALEELGRNPLSKDLVVSLDAAGAKGKVKSRITRSGCDVLLVCEGTAAEGGEVFVPCGSRVISVFGGAADRGRFGADNPEDFSPPVKQKTNLTPENRELNSLYHRVRDLREEGAGAMTAPGTEMALSEIYRLLEKKYPADWLLRYEILELLTAMKIKASWEPHLRHQLEELSKGDEARGAMIRRGMECMMDGHLGN